MLLPTIVAACGSTGSAPGNGEAGGPGDDDAGPRGIADGSPMGDDAGQAFDVTPPDAPTDTQPIPGDAAAFIFHVSVRVTRSERMPRRRTSPPGMPLAHELADSIVA
jgi:hypothetical protein